MAQSTPADPLTARVIERLATALATAAASPTVPGDRPELAATLDLHRALLRLETSVPAPSATPPDAADRLRRGEPLLEPAALAVEPAALAERLGRVVELVAAARPDLADELARLCAFAAADAAGPELVAAHLAGELAERAAAAGLDADLLSFALGHALRPWLRAAALALAPLVADADWARGRCPVCGGEPDFALLALGAGARRLLCSRCDAEWAYARAGCPFCGEATVGYFAVPNSPYRLYTCDACGRYLKTLDGREVGAARLLPAERLLTVGLDLAARQAGYV